MGGQLIASCVCSLVSVVPELSSPLSVEMWKSEHLLKPWREQCAPLLGRPPPHIQCTWQRVGRSRVTCCPGPASLLQKEPCQRQVKSRGRSYGKKQLCSPSLLELVPSAVTTWAGGSRGEGWDKRTWGKWWRITCPLCPGNVSPRSYSKNRDGLCISYVKLLMQYRRHNSCAAPEVSASGWYLLYLRIQLPD